MLHTMVALSIPAALDSIEFARKTGPPFCNLCRTALRDKFQKKLPSVTLP